VAMRDKRRDFNLMYFIIYIYIYIYIYICLVYIYVLSF